MESSDSARNPKDVDRLVLADALLGLTLLFLGGDADESVDRKPRNALDVAVAFLRKAVDGLAAVDEESSLVANGSAG